MKTLIKIAGVLLILAGCQNANKPAIVPAIVPNAQKTTEVKKMPLNIIGAVEPIYLLPMKSAFDARIDTGATTSSLDVDEMNEFERDGEKWVSFTVKNRRSGEVYTFEKPVIKSIKIKRIDDKEVRLKVLMPVSFGGEKFVSEFTLAKREKFEYQVLIGRNILSGRAIVDTSLSHTLK